MGFKARHSTRPPADLARVWARLRSAALRMKGTREDFPWGETVVKVGSKVFVFLGRPRPGELTFSVKLGASADDVPRLRNAEPTGHGLGRKGWVTLRFDSESVPDFAVLRGWLEDSYESISGESAR